MPQTLVSLDTFKRAAKVLRFSFEHNGYTFVVELKLSCRPGEKGGGLSKRTCELPRYKFLKDGGMGKHPPPPPNPVIKKCCLSAC